MIRDAADTVKKVSMELGGNAPLIVYEDADLESALDLSVATKYANSGQVCVTPDRFFVHECFTMRSCRASSNARAGSSLGDGLDPETGMGPLINRGRLEEIDAIVR